MIQYTDNTLLLIISSAAGALVRALNPANTGTILVKASEGVIGVLSAVFLGPVIATLIIPHVSSEVYATSASGFIMGMGGIEMTKLITGRLFKK